jgi:hypothetical protein
MKKILDKEYMYMYIVNIRIKNKRLGGTKNV